MKQFVLESHCSDENVDPQPDFVVINISPAFAKALLNNIALAQSNAQIIGSNFYRLTLLDSSAAFVEAGFTDEATEEYLEITDIQTEGRDITAEEIEQFRGEVEMSEQYIHFETEGVSFSGKINYSYAYCFTDVISLEQLQQIRDAPASKEGAADA